MIMRKILVIEDEAMMRAYLSAVLEMERFQPLLAANGREGIDAAKRELPDLILCDVTMPVKDGYEVLKALRADAATARIPFVFVTGKSEREDARAGMDLGADDYLFKPVRLEDLMEAIAARLERSQQQAGFRAVFTSAAPLERLGLSPREAEILLWVAQGKTNLETGLILGISPNTVKKHLEHIYEKLEVESRNGATLRALETLSSEII
jgi:DNA-binding NarL/FixJ family response regulator